ncbi:MAG: F0F1 ATP synthase subunit B [Pseudomonadota bacterium]
MFESIVFWEILAFAIFVGAVFKPIRNKLLGMLDARIQHVRTSLEEAEKLREEAQATLANFQRKQREAIEEAAAILARAKEEAGRLRERGLTDLNAALERRERMATDGIAQAEREAVREIRGRAVEIAIASATKVLAESLEPKTTERLIARAIADLPAKLH